MVSIMVQLNLKRAYSQWSEELLDSCAKQAEFRGIAFALAYFHAALLERKKFGVGNLPGATSGAALNPHAVCCPPRKLLHKLELCWRRMNTLMTCHRCSKPVL